MPSSFDAGDQNDKHNNVAGELLEHRYPTRACSRCGTRPGFAANRSFQSLGRCLVEDKDIARASEERGLGAVNIGADGAFGSAVRTGPSQTTT